MTPQLTFLTERDIELEDFPCVPYPDDNEVIEQIIQDRIDAREFENEIFKDQN